MPRSVLMSDTASAPASCAARATAGTSVALGVSFTISGLAVSGRTWSSSAAVSAGSAPMIRPLSTFGQETLSSSADDLVPRPDGLDERGDLIAAVAHDVDDQRHGQPGELREVVAEVALERPCSAGRSS